jgi:hypothetical protein
MNGVRELKEKCEHTWTAGAQLEGSFKLETTVASGTSI